MNSLHPFKIQYLRQLAQVQSFSSSWDVWSPIIKEYLGASPSAQKVFDLGDNLSEIFRENAAAGRGQGSLSGGGTAWECLISWYLNLVFWSTPICAVRQNKSFVPKVINDAVTVTISNNQTNTESDILIFSLPDEHELTGTELQQINDHLGERLNHVSLVNLQCKTNWNDNAQVPMLWDMIYNSESKLPHVNVGINGVTPQSVGKFSYAFVTVPSNKVEKIKPSSVCVLRVKNLTGGNYWGRQTKSDVASSIKELFTRNFASFFAGGVVNKIKSEMENNPDYIHQFLDLDW